MTFTPEELKIEIFATDDPCFNCQVKLQWFTNILRQELKKIFGDRDGNVIISYHANKEDIALQDCCTRPKEESGALKAFIFSNGDNGLVKPHLVESKKD